MPTYQYVCTDCGEQLEAVQKFTDDPLTVCPACEGRLRKQFNAVGIVFKGSGFYRTDSRNGSDRSKGDAAAKKGSDAGKATSGSASSDTSTNSGDSGKSAGASASSSGSSSNGSSSNGSSSNGSPAGSSSSSPAKAATG